MTSLSAPMTVPILCIVAAYFLVYLPHFIAGSQRFKQPGGYDNTHPRDQSARLEGWARRAAAAHVNGHETFTPFALAVLVAWIGHANPGTVATLGITYVVVRALYVVAYIGNFAPVRSLLWAGGLAITVALFLLPLFS